MKKQKRLFLVALLTGLALFALGASYNTLIYKTQGGKKMVVQSGGEIDMQSGSTLTDDGAQASAIADLDSGTQTAYEDLIPKINAILTAIRGVGIVAE